MEILMSNWTDVQSLPKSYVFPPDRRPGENVFPVCKNVPVIDLEKAEGLDRVETIQQILNASQEFGFFQVINHGVSESLMDDTMSVFKEFYGMPAEYKAGFYSNDINKSCRIYSSTLNYNAEEVHYWRDNFTHRCHPIEDHIQHWPERPARYREIVGIYSVEVRKFLLRILNLISEGLGVEPGYFDGDISKTQLLSVNHHIPCPDPSLTLGMPEHCDPNLISMLQQCSVPGLQVFLEGKWMGVEPLPNAFLVIPGLQLKVISNGKFTSPIHRVVTSSDEARTTIGSFLIPSHDILIEPAKSLLDAGHPPDYKAFTYKEFFSTFTEKNCVAEVALEFFKNKPK
ncbi:2-oxoglutarate (2OG) and Fe(II)-dependent oxygenase superfamily protein [Forsythia ovata]|uniref:2-oxoglutarate (2OG) and Fe(II)-dependent oxygenase superfamily protein n=1 Tax=Forsythia ovata TaxID=205694 RepID=A0ABD1X4N6_9LAMI